MLLIGFKPILDSALYRGQRSGSATSTLMAGAAAGSPSRRTGSFSLPPAMAATSRAMPQCPHKSGRCVIDLLSISIILSGAQPGIGAPTGASSSTIPTCSRLIASSAPEASMPSLSTPWMTFLPIGAQTAFMPARQLGAPQTTVRRPSGPASISAMVRCVPAIGSAVNTRTTSASASRLPTTSMPSHSAVFMVINRSSGAGAQSRPSTSSRIQL